MGDEYCVVFILDFFGVENFVWWGYGVIGGLFFIVILL